MHAVELTGLAAAIAEIRDLLQGITQDHAHFFVGAVGKEQEFLLRVARKSEVPGRARAERLLDALWFAPLVEWLIAASIVFMALENMLGTSLTGRWILSFIFGLVHGVGFAAGLRENLQFAGQHLFVALASFNVGIELGQIVVLVVAIGVLRWTSGLYPERAMVLIASALIAHIAWHWGAERWAILERFSMPVPDASALPQIMRWLAAALALAFALRIVDRAIRKRQSSAAELARR